MTAENTNRTPIRGENVILTWTCTDPTCPCTDIVETPALDLGETGTAVCSECDTAMQYTGAYLNESEEEVPADDDTARPFYMEKLLFNLRELESKIKKEFQQSLMPTREGVAALSSLIGYTAGLRHARHEDLADRIIRDLVIQLRKLTSAVEVFRYIPKTKDPVTVPARKVILLGNGAKWPDLSFLTLRAVPPVVYEKRMTDIAATSGCSLEVAAKRADRELGVPLYLENREKVSVSLPTEVPGLSIRYAAAVPGMLKYNGPSPHELLLTDPGPELLWTIQS